MKRSLLSFSLLLLVFSAFAYKQELIDINVNGKQRNMVVFTPNTLPDKSPLFIVTHGMNQNPEYQYGADKMYEMIDTAKFVISYLRSDGNTWDVWGTNDQSFVLKTIDEMASRFNIDTDRVYWSGFSMGSMLIHHCIGSVQDKIAAFAPTSGVLSGEPWNSCTKPVNLLECIAYDDEVFGYEEYNIHSYIESYAKHDNHPNYSKTVGYKPISSSWYNGDLECWTGGANGGEVWLYSFHNGGHWPMDLNRHLIWNFCKRFTLNMPMVRITQPAGDATYLCMAPQGEATFPDITIKATAKTPNVKITKADFYDGNTFIESKTSLPYSTTLSAPAAGKHNLRVEVTDKVEKTAQATCLINCIASKSSYNLHQNFTAGDVVPQDWYVSNGLSKRVGGGTSYTDGSRLLHFTNSSRAFEYGLLVQNGTNRAKAAWAKFGDKSARSYLTLHSGHYALKYKICNWNQPEFTPVTVAIESTSGQEVASDTYTPTVNIGGDTGNKFTLVRQQTIEFDIEETGNYVIVFYTDAAKNADFVLGQAILQPKEFFPTGIQTVARPVSVPSDDCVDFSGRLVSKVQSARRQLPHGLYIIGGRKTAIR